MKAFLHPVLILLAALLLNGLTACSPSDAGSPATPTPTDGPLRIKIVLSGLHPRSLDYEENGDECGNEYYIAPHDIEVLIYRTDGTLAERMEQKAVILLAEYHDQYELTGELKRLTPDDLDGICKVVVLANLKTTYPTGFPYGTETGGLLPGLSEAKLYEQTRFDYPGSAEFTGAVLTGQRQPEDENRIPMWGSVTLRLADHIYHFQDQPSKNPIRMELLRALAKVEVYMEGVEGLSLQKVTLHKGCKDGFLTARDAATWSCTRRVLGADASLHTGTLPETDEEEIPFYESDGHFYLYIPEQEADVPTPGKNGFSVTHTAAYMTVTLSKPHLAPSGEDGETGTDLFDYPLYFADYNPVMVKPFPVLRNWWYEFIITGAGKEHALQYKVCKWGDRESDIDFH